MTTTDPLQNLRERLQDLERNERSETANAMINVAFADLPTPGEGGRWRYVTDGRKMGEGPGAGTGVPAYDGPPGPAWRRPSDDTVVLN